MTDKYYVAIAGNIGVGKTTMTKLISEKLSWEAFYEPVIENPYLDDFYKDMEKWSFHLQVYFLSKRFELQKKIVEENISCVQDRTIYEDVEIFARTLFEQGSMTERDFLNYCELFKNMTSYLQKPNLIVYLRASIDELQKRIMQRGRDSEKTISRKYLQKLNDAYENWLPEAKNMTNVVTIETQNRTENELSQEADRIIRKIEEFCPPSIFDR
ncbi:MAG: deoxynucleoside kinase [Candidatus Cloacimonetes bacterium]|nr:deoxynucleoside kinase [Candidatus Cloacimonadota bacterium]MBS3767538.1 deoxynucleoside kinase [Candidatus Cloacimonadota bacterium]